MSRERLAVAGDTSAALLASGLGMSEAGKAPYADMAWARIDYKNGFVPSPPQCGARPASAAGSTACPENLSGHAAVATALQHHRPFLILHWLLATRSVQGPAPTQMVQKQRDAVFPWARGWRPIRRQKPECLRAWLVVLDPEAVRRYSRPKYVPIP